MSSGSPKRNLNVAMVREGTEEQVGVRRSKRLRSAKLATARESAPPQIADWSLSSPSLSDGHDNDPGRRGDGLNTCMKAHVLQVFNNSLVMENVGQTLSARELLALRETCTAWNVGFIAPLRRKHSPIKLKEKYGGGHGDRAKDNTSAEVMQHFIAVLRSSEGIPFASYRIEARVNYGDPDEWRTAFEEFVCLAGASATFLDISWVHEYLLSINELRTLVYERMPVLSALYIRPCQYRADEDEDKTSVDVEMDAILPSPSAVRRLPNLRRFNVTPNLWGELRPTIARFVAEPIRSADNLDYFASTFPHDERRGLSRLSALLTTLQEYPRRLKTLKLAVRSPDQLESLVQLGLSLETLTLSVVCLKTSTVREAREMVASLYEFLERQAPTLRKLNLDFEFVNRHMDRGGNASRKYGAPFLVPRMERLRTLKLSRSEALRIDLVFEGSRGREARSKTRTQATKSLASTFPALTRFSYRHFDDGHHSAPMENLKADLKQVAHPGVADLAVTAPCTHFQSLGPSLFPAVTSYKVTLERQGATDTPWNIKEGIQGLWTLWPGLTSLHIDTRYHTAPGPGMLWAVHLSLDELVSGRDSHSSSFCNAYEPSQATLDEEQQQRGRVVVPVSVPLSYPYEKSIRTIKDLRELNELTLVGPSQVGLGNSTGFTNYGAYHGLALAGPLLKRVSILGPNGETGKRRISERCRAHLQNALGPDAIIKI